MFDFNWKFQDFEIRTVHHNKKEYIELVKWDESCGKPYCFTLAYWTHDNDRDYSLRFVGDRPWTEIAEIDISVIWKQLFLAQQMFEDAMSKLSDD